VNWSNKPKYCISLGQKSFAMTNALAYWENSKVMKKRNAVNMAPGVAFTTLLVLRNLWIGPMS